jgi:hypothetical protein
VKKAQDAKLELQSSVERLESEKKTLEDSLEEEKAKASAPKEAEAEAEKADEAAA